MSHVDENQKVCNIRSSQAVSVLSTNRTQWCLTWQIGRDAVYSPWYGRRHQESQSKLDIMKRSKIHEKIDSSNWTRFGWRKMRVKQESFKFIWVKCQKYSFVLGNRIKVIRLKIHKSVENTVSNLLPEVIKSHWALSWPPTADRSNKI